ncbi:MAG TPA: ABC transporter ATP-binding protein [Chloroflexus aurantiacus]|uniref:ABC transporter related n=1 Tax=Chloroflexus aurantiacus (strain ATCC 29366 / DSM 635 / J-10-fl) TaxID=324602 RepID=A9WF95_CHLAA|nr:ABC transporter ATP-binding protein [Chloroflexus aurantiacus]ABY36079.1 ABC transporter related [Chloroflexus aurantiacus J-10-fl]RMG47909.1 MAG: ABC transporter ATP-binding protein [Chloroflexota bacterium]GIV91385.1 MAG: ABC transporter ATP-binding protein [Chloroflexus sp.]HBW67423.1 ABC transporter ATP-binding protein [Chloroflexus aurantiacus]
MVNDKQVRLLAFKERTLLRLPFQLIPPPQAASNVSWSRLLSYLRPYRGWIVVALIAMVISAGLGLVIPLAIGQVVNLITGDQALPVVQIAQLLGIVMIGQLLTGVIQTYCLSFVGERVVSDLRIAAYEHLQKLDLAFFEQRRTGEITSRITNDVTLIQTTVTNSLPTLLGGVIQLVGAVALMLVVSWQLSGLALILVPTLVLIGVFFGRWLRQISTAVQDRLADATSILEETVAGVRVVRSFRREDYEITRFRAAVEATFATALKLARIRAIFQPAMSLAVWMALIGILAIGGYLVSTGVLTTGSLISFLFYAVMAAGSMGVFASLFAQLQEALGATTRVFELLDQQPLVADAPDAIPLPPVEGRIEFREVSFAYQSATSNGSPAPVVLRDFSLTIEAGEMVALVGPSGAGKSTIASLIPRFYDVSAGSVLIDGYDVRRVQIQSLRDQIGIVLQETQLFSGSVRDNIRYGRLEATDEEIEAAARMANAHEFICQLPDGYDTPVGERGVRLSGGQRQRIAIARAILKNPRILILDEATSSLDSESERLVQEALERLMAGRTSIVIAHRLSTVQRADRIAVIVAGELVEIGTHHELLARDGVYARLYERQFLQPIPATAAV